MRILTILLIWFPFAAQSEGARMELDCAATLLCDQAGSCRPGNAPFTAVIQPVEIDTEGDGSYEVSSSGASFPATAVSRTGPFHWTPEVHATATLTLTSETTALYVRQDLTPGGGATPSARINFLKCEVIF